METIKTNMKAFVKTNNGTFPNLNFYLAWEAFNTMGYSVSCFEEQDIDKLDITPLTPVFAGVTVFRKIIDKLGVKYAPFDCYPQVLNPYYGRNLIRSTLGEAKANFENNKTPVFVKPVLPKQFTGGVWNSFMDLIPLARLPNDTQVWVCEPIDILSEFRVYVLDGEILGVKHYYGKWQYTPDEYYINKFIKEYKGAPVAYGIDIAVLDKTQQELETTNRSGLIKDIVLEVNDGCNLGNYGLDSIHYGEMIVSRWYEIMEQGGKGADLRTQAIKSEYKPFPTQQ